MALRAHRAPLQGAQVCILNTLAHDVAERMKADGWVIATVRQNGPSDFEAHFRHMYASYRGAGKTAREAAEKSIGAAGGKFAFVLAPQRGGKR